MPKAVDGESTHQFDTVTKKVAKNRQNHPVKVAYKDNCAITHCRRRAESHGQRLVSMGEGPSLMGRISGLYNIEPAAPTYVAQKHQHILQKL